MIFIKLKAAILSLTLILPTALTAGGCVEDADNIVTFVENGQTYYIDPITSFGADLRQNDAFNSRGTRLSTPGAVLQQYVANRRKAGQRVTDNNFFHSLERRSLLSNSDLYVGCWGSQSYRQKLLNSITVGRVQATVLWVVAFRHPNGRIAFYLSPAG